MSRKVRRSSGAPRKALRESRRAGRAEPPAPHMELTRGLGVALAAIAAAGAAVSVYLTYVRHLVLMGADAGALCSIDDWLNCRTVLTSPYATIAGVPISLLALWFYLVTAVVALMGLRRNRGRLPRSPAAVLFLAYATATGISAALGVVSVAFIGSFCPLCVSLYALNLIALVVARRAVLGTGETVSQAVRRERSYWSARRGAAMRFAAIAIAPVVLLFAITRVLARDAELCRLTAAASGDSPLHVWVFSDFQCPHCQALHLALRPVRDNPDVLVHLRHYPLEAECNPRVRREGHQGACLQARAAICANAEGRLLDLSDRLFDAGPTEARGLVALAESLGMDASRFAACLHSGETSQALNRDVRAAIDAGVRGTPTIFVNGHRLTHVPTAEDIRCLVVYRRASESAGTHQ